MTHSITREAGAQGQGRVSLWPQTPDWGPQGTSVLGAGSSFARVQSLPLSLLFRSRREALRVVPEDTFSALFFSP